MKNTYICEGAIVRSKRKEGYVICVNREKNVVVIRGKKSVWTERPQALSVVSYGGTI